MLIYEFQNRYSRFVMQVMKFVGGMSSWNRVARKGLVKKMIQPNGETSLLFREEGLILVK